MPIREEAVNVFLNQPGDGDEPKLELTYNFGVDSYELGTAYGHIAISSSDLDGMLARSSESGHRAGAPALHGSARTAERICFVRDPDGYRVEIVERTTSGRPG